MEEQLTLLKAMQLTGEFGDSIRRSYRGTPDNAAAIVHALLTEAVSIVFAEFLEPDNESAHFVMESTERLVALLDEIRNEVIKKQRRSKNWSN